MLKQAVILVGGKGTRLGALAQDCPKPLIQVGNRPFLDLHLESLNRHGFEEVILLAGYLADQVVDLYDGKQFGNLRIRVVAESSPLGTGGALRNAISCLDETFLLLNGDSIFDINLRALSGWKHDHGWEIKMSLREVPDVSRYGHVEINADKQVVSFKEKSETTLSCKGLINAGIYLIRRSVVESMKEGPVSLEQEIMPKLANDGKLLGLPFDGYFIDIGVPTSLEQARFDYLSGRPRPAAFLDRDGTLNENGSGYTHKPNELVWINGAKNAIRRLNDAGFFVFVATNQSGIARGYYGLGELQTFHETMQQELFEEGAHIDDFYYCPFHPEGTIEKYARPSGLRKPNPGMLARACSQWNVDRSRSFMVGDAITDVIAAEHFGIPGLLFDGTNLNETIQNFLEHGHH